MRFLSKILPLILLTLLIAFIYYGGKRIIKFIDDNPEAYAAHLVAKNQEEGYDDETYDAEAPYKEAAENNVASAPDFDVAIVEEDFEKDIDFEDNLADVKTDNPEATLDAELEGKSSNQLIAAKQKKASPTKPSKTSSAKKLADSKTKAKTSSTKGTAKSKSQGIAATKKTNKKPARDNLAIKGRTPTAYGSYNKDTQFKVIAGSFKSKENANIFIDDLEKKGLKNLEIIEIKSKNLNRVVVSRHPTYEAAKKAIKELKQYYNVDSYVHVPTN